jgi:3-mercaptopyruvate sulfurtransferase SseA
MDSKTKDFLQRLKDSGNWNDNYDYSKVVYSGRSSKVIVIDSKFNTEHLIYSFDLMKGTKCADHNVKMLNYEEVKKFVAPLKLKTQREWNVYSKSGSRPHNIPANPNQRYRYSGWVSWGEFLDNNRYRRNANECLTFEEVKEFVKKLNINSKAKWDEFCKSGNKPYNIPGNPHIIYKDSGWINWGDFLNTNRRCDGQYLTFKEAKEFALKLNLKTLDDWQVYRKSGNRPSNIHSNPDFYYKNSGWVSWGDFLRNGELFTKFLSYEEAKEFVQKLKIKNERSWVEYFKSGKRPENIPSDPRRVYKDSGWISFSDFSGIKRKISSFEEAKEFVQKLKIKSKKEWNVYSKSGNRPNNIPSNPNIIYKDSGWISFPDFLNYEKNLNYSKCFLTFDEAKEFVKKLNIKGQKEWNVYSKSGNRPNNIPSSPDTVYRGKGWVSWQDFL